MTEGQALCHTAVTQCLSLVTPLLSYLALPSHPLLRILYIRSIFAQFSDYSSCYNKLYAIALFGPAAGPGMHV